MSKDLPDVYTPTKRKALTPKQRLKMFLQHEGVCVICKGRIDGVRERWIDEHIIALADGGTNDLENRGPAHEKCARKKTSSEAGTRSRHRKAAERHLGAKGSGGFATNRGGKYKRKMDGTLVCRATGKIIGGDR